MLFVTRAEWGASTGPDSPAADLPTALGVKVHWIGGDYTTPDHDQCAAEVRAILHEHLTDPNQGWVDIAYNLLVCGHGYVFEGRGIGKESGANGNQPLNLADYAVCAIVGTHEADSPALLDGLRDAIDYLRANGAGDRLGGHSDGYNTDCPGPTLYAWAHAGAPRPDGTPPASAGYPAYPGHLLRVTSPMMHGDDIAEWQSRMQDRNWRIVVDGWYGPQSEHVCRQFQQEKGLQIDGIVGPITWAAAWTAPETP